MVIPQLMNLLPTQSPQADSKVTNKISMDWVTKEVGMNKEMYHFLIGLEFSEKNEILTQDDDEIEDLHKFDEVPRDQNKKLKKYVEENGDAAMVEELEQRNRRYIKQKFFTPIFSNYFFFDTVKRINPTNF